MSWLYITISGTETLQLIVKFVEWSQPSQIFWNGGITVVNCIYLFHLIQVVSVYFLVVFIVCTVEVDNDPIVTNQNQDQDFQLTNCKSCNHILSVSIWNLQSGDDKKGIWSSITDEAASYVTLRKSKVVNILW